ncbi:hypothetical protein INR49_001820, partial [Caranx melampygus]
MDAGIEKECSALGGLFQLIMNDMKGLRARTYPFGKKSEGWTDVSQQASYPTWEDFLTKGAKLQSQL